MGSANVAKGYRPKGRGRMVGKRKKRIAKANLQRGLLMGLARKSEPSRLSECSRPFSTKQKDWRAKEAFMGSLSRREKSPKCRWHRAPRDC